MNELVNIVNRFLAPFCYGGCMATAATVENFTVMAAMIWLSSVFAILSTNSGRHMLERVLSRISDGLCIRGARAAG